MANSNDTQKLAELLREHVQPLTSGPGELDALVEAMGVSVA